MSGGRLYLSIEDYFQPTIERRDTSYQVLMRTLYIEITTTSSVFFENIATFSETTHSLQKCLAQSGQPAHGSRTDQISI